MMRSLQSDLNPPQPQLPATPEPEAGGEDEEEEGAVEAQEVLTTEHLLTSDQASGGALVRCSHPHPSGRGYCSTPNFPEAKECRVCGGRVSHQDPLVSTCAGGEAAGGQGGKVEGT